MNFAFLYIHVQSDVFKTKSIANANDSVQIRSVH